MSELVVDTSTVATALGQDHRAQHYSRGDVEIRFVQQPPLAQRGGTAFREYGVQVELLVRIRVAKNAATLVGTGGYPIK